MLNLISYTNIIIHILNTLQIINSMEFEELDGETRRCMLIEFEKEESSGNPYRSPRLNNIGKERFQEIMRNAIISGDISSLAKGLSNLAFWNKTESCTTNGRTHQKNIPRNAGELLAHSEFTTWYTRGFAKRLIEEGIDLCEVYRAGTAQTPRCECTNLEGERVKVKDIYDGHRARYHPTGDLATFSIPSVPWCHHTIRRPK